MCELATVAEESDVVLSVCPPLAQLLSGAVSTPSVAAGVAP